MSLPRVLLRSPGRTCLLAACMLLAASCSVSTPRDGFTVSASEESQLGTSSSPTGAQERGGPGSDIGSEGAAETSAAVAGSTGDLSGDLVQSPASASGGGDDRGAPDAGGGGGAPGVTKDAVVVSVIAGFGGSYGPLLDQMVEGGLGTWQAGVNKGGGIHGRQVVVKKVDHKETGDGGIAACKEVQGNGSFMAFIAEGAEGHITAADCLDKAGIPFLYWGAAKRFSKNWSIGYSVLAASDDQGISLSSFVKNVMKDGDKKLGVMYVNQPAFQDAATAYIAQAKADGMTIARVEPVEFNQASFTPQLVRMQNAGVENLAMFVAVEAIGIMRDARALSYQPRFTGAVWVYDFVTQGAQETAVGAMALRYSATVDTPAYVAFEKKAAEHGKSGALNGEAMLFYGYGLVLGKVLDAAGASPTRETLISGIQSIKDYVTNIIPPITWGPGDLIGHEASFPAECCTAGYAWKGLGPPASRF